MVPISEQEFLWAGFRADPVLSQVAEVIFESGKLSSEPAASSDVRAARAVYQNDKRLFEEVLEEMQHRTPSPDATWVSNDALLFFLLVGLRKFGFSMPRFGEVITIRERSAHGFAQVVNKAFRELFSGDEAIGEDGGFIKAVARRLTSGELPHKTELSPLYQSISGPQFIHELPPFFRVLALRGQSLLFEAKDTEGIETVSALITKLHGMKSQFRIGDYLRLLWALPLVVVLSFSTLLGLAFYLGHKSYDISDYIAASRTDERVVAFDVAAATAQSLEKDVPYANLPLPAAGSEIAVISAIVDEGSARILQVKVLVSHDLISQAFMLRTDRATGSVEVCPAAAVDSGLLWVVHGHGGKEKIQLVVQSMPGVTGFLDRVRQMRITEK